MFLGIVGEYLGSVFDEVKRRPLYVVDEVIEGPGR
jgi:dolichol-phosphate mannosyltransferase